MTSPETGGVVELDGESTGGVSVDVTSFGHSPSDTTSTHCDFATHALEYVFLSLAQTGRYSIVHATVSPVALSVSPVATRGTHESYPVLVHVGTGSATIEPVE
jgi:hypothetical protein